MLTLNIVEYKPKTVDPAFLDKFNLFHGDMHELLHQREKCYSQNQVSFATRRIERRLKRF